MKMEIENNSQNSLVKTGNRAIFAAPKGESARIATAKTAFCTYFARLPFRKTRNLWFSSAKETATPPTNVVICFKISIFASAITTLEKIY